MSRDLWRNPLASLLKGHNVASGRRGRQIGMYTQVAYTSQMKAVFIELPAFERHRDDYLDDDGFAQLQVELMVNPVAGDLIEGTGGLRKLRFKDSRRSKGKRGGLRVIFYYWTGGPEFWLFTLYDKDEMSDLTPKQRATLKEIIKDELKMRRKS
jgi:hypothetical protein